MTDAKIAATAGAAYAIRGLELPAEIGIHGMLRLHTYHFGRVQHLDDLDHASAFLAQVANGQ